MSRELGPVLGQELGPVLGQELALSSSPAVLTQDLDSYTARLNTYPFWSVLYSWQTLLAGLWLRHGTPHQPGSLYLTLGDQPQRAPSPG